MVTTAGRAVEGALVGGGLGRLGAALARSGVRRHGLLLCREALEADGFLVVGHGTEVQSTRVLVPNIGQTRPGVRSGGDILDHVAA